MLYSLGKLAKGALLVIAVGTGQRIKVQLGAQWELSGGGAAATWGWEGVWRG
jgi:hypothetical protein